MRWSLKHFLKNSQRKAFVYAGFAFLTLAVTGCTTTVSTAEIEKSCNPQASDFAVKADCIIRTYNAVPEENRGQYEDLDSYYINQVALLADQYKKGEINAVQAEAALSRVRVDVETQRRERNYMYDRGRFGVGVGVGTGGTGYWGNYGY